MKLCISETVFNKNN